VTLPIPPQTDIVHRVPLQRARNLRAEVIRWTITAVITGVVGITLLGGSLIAAIYMSARTNQERPVDAIIVMGAAQFNGVPSHVLQARLDTAYQAWTDGVAPVIIVTGGRLPGDSFTESEASRDYLVYQGVPEEAILLENEGNNSAVSLHRAAQIAKEHQIKRVLIVSDGFHLFRSRMIAEHEGLTAYGMPASNSPIRKGSRTELDYVVREAAAVIAFKLG